MKAYKDFKRETEEFNDKFSVCHHDDSIKAWGEFVVSKFGQFLCEYVVPFLKDERTGYDEEANPYAIRGITRFGSYILRIVFLIFVWVEAVNKGCHTADLVSCAAFTLLIAVLFCYYDWANFFGEYRMSDLKYEKDSLSFFGRTLVLISLFLLPILFTLYTVFYGVGEFNSLKLARVLFRLLIWIFLSVVIFKRSTIICYFRMHLAVILSLVLTTAGMVIWYNFFFATEITELDDGIMPYAVIIFFALELVKYIIERRKNATFESTVVDEIAIFGSMNNNRFF